MIMNTLDFMEDSDWSDFHDNHYQHNNGWMNEQFSKYKLEKTSKELKHKLNEIRKQKFEEIMKTLEDIKKLSIEEIKGMMLFSEQNFSIAELFNCYIDESEPDGYIYKFAFKNGSIAKTEKKDMYEAVVENKAIYDMYLSSINSGIDSTSKYIENIVNDANEKIETLKHHLSTNIKSNTAESKELIEKLTKNMFDVFSETIASLEKGYSEKFDELEAKINKGVKAIESGTAKINKAVTKIDGIDVEAFNTKMAKLDTIIEKFETLLV